MLQPLLDFRRKLEGNNKCRVELRWKCACRGVFPEFWCLQLGVPITKTINTITITAAAARVNLSAFNLSLYFWTETEREENY